MLNRDQRLNLSVQEYFNTGRKDAFLKEAWVWVREICLGRFQLDEDASSEVTLHLIQNADRCLEIFQTRNYSNFPAYLTVFIKNLILNQRKKEISKGRREKLILISEERGYDEGDDFEGKIVLEEENVSALVRKTLSELSPIACLIVKMRHQIRLNLRDIRLLRSRLDLIDFELRTYLREDEEEIRTQRLRRKAISDQLLVLFGRIHSADQDEVTKWRQRKNDRLGKMDRISDEKSFRRISAYLSFSEHSVRRIYYDAIRTIRERGYWKEIGISKVA
ncbi:hypothetical protein LEP1GSC058_1180 [Leptospira fainei serovar Hurstbridge str. BUT 6]|uniref:Uncharacterized protein n=1 Tax=Leptospira fainei serovar Hurstbridge str. BUT 6 TaxID=1193011 RepID=S3V6N2_9LEPT|nr:hypothetical protein [Leptospira fainei]EPG76329.1 hypothetical protein LEP1GSC058_1180 [Leptospira fainei serovar Hurstbridge str. BUT 6]